MSTESNKDLSKKVQSILKELGYDMKLGHAYELLSKLSGHNSWNVAKAKSVDLAKALVVQPNDHVRAVKDLLGNGTSTYEVKLKAQTEAKLYLKVTASSFDEARRIAQEYIDEDVLAPSSNQVKNWEVTYIEQTPYIESVLEERKFSGLTEDELRDAMKMSIQEVTDRFGAKGDLYDWVKKLGQWHKSSSGSHTTLCGMPMLGNNYASHIPVGERKPCADCEAEIMKRK